MTCETVPEMTYNVLSGTWSLYWLTHPTVVSANLQKSLTQPEDTLFPPSMKYIDIITNIRYRLFVLGVVFLLTWQTVCSRICWTFQVGTGSVETTPCVLPSWNWVLLHRAASLQASRHWWPISLPWDPTKSYVAIFTLSVVARSRIEYMRCGSLRSMISAFVSLSRSPFCRCRLLRGCYNASAAQRLLLAASYVFLVTFSVLYYVTDSFFPIAPLLSISTDIVSSHNYRITPVIKVIFWFQSCLLLISRFLHRLTAE